MRMIYYRVWCMLSDITFRRTEQLIPSCIHLFASTGNVRKESVKPPSLHGWEASIGLTDLLLTQIGFA